MSTPKKKKTKTREAQPIVSPRVQTMLCTRLNQLGETKAGFIRRFRREHKGQGAKNHLYKILGGTTHAGEGEDEMLPLLAKSLKLNLEELTTAVRKDKIEFANGWSDVIHSAESASEENDPLLREIVTRLDGFDERDRKDVLGYIRMKAGLSGSTPNV